jgi:hypothetical protein
MLAAGHAASFDLFNLCVWVKNNGGMGSLYGSGANFRDQCNETLGNITRFMRRERLVQIAEGGHTRGKLARRWS